MFRDAPPFVICDCQAFPVESVVTMLEQSFQIREPCEPAGKQRDKMQRCLIAKNVSQRQGTMLRKNASVSQKSQKLSFTSPSAGAVWS